MDLEEARAALFAQLAPISRTEVIPLSEASGRVSAAGIKAQLALPPFRASAMDGYALARQDFKQAKDTGLSVVGQSLAGHPFVDPIRLGQCVRIFTGAVVPPGADLILLQERLAETITATDGSVTVRFEQHDVDEDYIRPVGNDVQLNQVLAEPGDLLTPLRLGSLAAAGVNTVEVYGRVTVGIFSSGDELKDPSTPPDQLGLGEIYDSNAFTLANLLERLPVQVVELGRLPDEPSVVRQALADGAKRCDMLVTSGGVSVGDADFIGATIAELGDLAFWRLNLKPGKPLAFGSIGDCWIFGLPGNPVSTIVTCLLLVMPSLKRLCGTDPQPILKIPATLSSPLSHRPGRAEYQRGIYSGGPSGSLTVRHTGDQGSNRLSTFAGANCLIEVPKDSGDLASGAGVNVLPLSDLLD
jgi:molybdopterin molybdotransferase